MKNLFCLDMKQPKEVRLALIRRYMNNKFPEPNFKEPKSVYTLPDTIKEFKQKQRRLNKKEMI